MVPIQQNLVRKPKIQKNCSLCLSACGSPRAPGSVSTPVRLRPSALRLSPKLAFDSSAPSSRPPHLGNGNSGSGRAQAPRRPSASMKEAAHWLLLWICYGHDNLIVHYIAY